MAESKTERGTIMMITPTQIRVTEDRRRELLSEAARLHLGTTASLSSRPTMAPQAGRILGWWRTTFRTLVGSSLVRRSPA